MVLLEEFKQHVLSVFVGYIPHHNRCPAVQLHILQINVVSLRFLIANGSPISYRLWFCHIIIVLLWNYLHHERVTQWNTHISGSWVTMRSKSSRDRIRTVFSVLCNDSHTRIHNFCNNLIFFLALRRIFCSPSNFRFTLRFKLIISFILEKEELVIEGVLTVRCDFPSVFARDSKLSERILFIFCGRTNSFGRICLERFVLMWRLERKGLCELFGRSDEALEIVGVVELDKLFILSGGRAL